VREYLDGLHWDGQDRSSSFLGGYLGATTLALGDHAGAFLAMLGRRWLVSAIARIYRPGCQVDTTLILEGGQGIGKTSALRALAGKPEWYSGSRLNIGDKDARMVLGTRWIVEMQELASMRRADIESLRAFLTETTDTYRAPYARRVETFPRCGVFVGTTNELTEYLTDPAGNRRFWPVRCTEIDLEGLERDRDQLWAQAVAALKGGEQHWLTAAESVMMETERADREAPGDTQAEAVAEAIARFYLQMKPADRPKSVAADKVAVDVLGVETSKLTGAIAKRAGIALTMLGAEPMRLFGVPGPGRSGRILSHSKRKVFRLPQWLMEAPQGARLEDVHEAESAATERESGGEL
jgi:predicted P-loop ATPase